MIHNLQGIHETVDYKADTQICLYYNDEAENYPPHWHTSFEVIMPVINDYRVVCGCSGNMRKDSVSARPAPHQAKRTRSDHSTPQSRHSDHQGRISTGL